MTVYVYLEKIEDCYVSTLIIKAVHYVISSVSIMIPFESINKL